MSKKSYAGFVRRSVAFLLDIPFLILLYYLSESLCVFLDDAWNLQIRTTLIVYCIFVILYFSILESSPVKATFGKMLAGIQIEHKDTQDKISFSRAILRFFVKLFSIAFFFIGIILTHFTRHKQALHDIVARSVVVKE